MRIHRHRQRKPKYNVQEYRVNQTITAPQVRVVDEDGTAYGVLDIASALTLAAQKEKDLVEVSPKGDPPVCRLLNYGHFRYQKEKEARKAKTQSHEVEVKGVRLTVRMGEGDWAVRLGQAKKFLERGDKVRLELILRGREKAHKEVGQDRINEFMVDLKGFFPLRVEQTVTFQAGRFIAILARE
ncbi:translation initiation factor IF-3 [Candidatus Uhrbacteria bacterium]|nr:translation initiation factor IF-3 [Candidatus Uhrbacteria bacterium]